MTGSNGQPTVTWCTQSIWVNGERRSINVPQQWLCPDLLRLEHIGAADGLRGRVVRAFFRMMERW